MESSLPFYLNADEVCLSPKVSPCEVCPACESGVGKVCTVGEIGVGKHRHTPKIDSHKVSELRKRRTRYRMTLVKVRWAVERGVRKGSRSLKLSGGETYWPI